MMIKLITRMAAGFAATSIAALPLIIGTSAHAINKHEQGGSDAVVLTPDTGREVDPAQVAAGALGGATITGAASWHLPGFAATAIRHPDQSEDHGPGL
jgi:hypothetical protein